MLTFEGPRADTTHAVYTQALGKGRALIPEMRLLLQAWQPGESESSLAERVLQQDLLGKSTARRVLDVVRVFSRRLLQPSDGAARQLKPLALLSAPRQVLSDLLFYYTALQDALLWDFTVLRYWPAVREGRLTLANREVAELLWEGEQNGRIARPWSAEIKRDMAGRVLGTLSDFGLLEEYRPATRRIALFRPADGTVLYLATLAHAQGHPDGLLADEPAWRLFGLEPHEVWQRLEQLAGDRWFVVQRAGQVAHITWRYSDPAEVIGALVGSR
jgi:hypothetical protein